MASRCVPMPSLIIRICCAALLLMSMPMGAFAQADPEKEYLVANAQKPDVTTTQSGLQYRVLREGTGKQPSATDTVVVHYKGMLTDGTRFDSSYERGEPARFPLNRVISGWTEGLQLMREGAQYELTIPSDLGYGERGFPGAIPGGATLIFEIELLEVE